MLPAPKEIHIIGGGTFFHVRPHLALAAPAFGATAEKLIKLCEDRFQEKMLVYCHRTKMADYGSDIETNEDVSKLLDELIEDLNVRVIFLSAALCDYEGTILDKSTPHWVQPMDQVRTPSGKQAERLRTQDGEQTMLLTPARKIISKIRKKRKDIFLIGFKTTAGASIEEQFARGLNLLKSSSCNLVLANDIHTRMNMIITPEESNYHQTTDRNEVLKELVDMVWHRTHLTFTRSTVVDGHPIPWSDHRVPTALRTVVDHCRFNGAYKEFRGSTVGHFAAKIDETTFLTSIRKTDFNDLHNTGLVMIKTDGPDSVIAYGAKPSVGGQSQRIVFSEHQDCDSIVHFHCPMKEGSEVPVMSQREYECGSHQCGQNTSNGLKRFGNLYAVMLDQHGPNIVFNSDINPQEVIDFIEANFDLSGKTDGLHQTHSPAGIPAAPRI